MKLLDFLWEKFMTDIEIAQKNVMDPIVKIAQKINISAENLELYGNYKAKISFNELKILQEKSEKAKAKLDAAKKEQSAVGAKLEKRPS